mmetsp:Transcript_1719/g.2695  ORF Transcript_1719/g.2695 Transcript_1719/m.2695 type:complete len:240 (-) Transcript_1719:102-821(-)|eukprot:CAMPEP_0185024698 /NCGR_PEP_ID=MMETSP1103-20130426/7880_1 /TAXON_ID=36769 /ORGANISM="Paraphysomonas bandaiensis, Strain Caron Lab Isolate" /LENGTH=239 /DNA_ID=CAMNT_0027557735 /DNA_START=44 /DNA_END=763 /DNA_ORIENTATION=-
MADSWEDEDPDDYATPQVSTKANWDDEDEEEDETLIEQRRAAEAAAAAAAKPTPAQIEAQKKRERDEAAKLENQLKFAQQENETEEQRRIRERKQVEEADADITAELFNAGGNPTAAKRTVSSGVAGISLRNREDHVNFGITVANKLADSTSFCLTAFLTEVLKRDGEKLSAESLSTLSTEIAKLQKTKKQAEDLVNKGKHKSKKAEKAKAKRHADIFGDPEDDMPEYEEYGNIEDDFF